MKYEPLSGREFPRFSGIKTFFRLPVAPVEADYEIGIAGVPFDGGLSYRPGARFAPSTVREASSLGRGYNWARGTHIWSQKKVADVGDCSTVPIDLAKTHEKIENFFDTMFNAGKKIIAVGGDHSVTLPILRAAHKKHGKLSLIHFDAHMDTYPAAWGVDFHHGTFARHAVEEGLVDPSRSIQIGLRGPLVDSNDLAFTKKHGLKTVTVDDIRIPGLEKFLTQLPSFNELPTYITFDVDCLDPVYAPGTGTPVVGGLTTYETQRILRALKIKNLVGGDVVEVSPPFDQSELTSLAAVDVIFEYLCLM
jgi:guanidinopropionase